VLAAWRVWRVRRGASRLDPSGDDDPWISTRNTTIAFDGLKDGEHILTVRAREAEADGGSSDKVCIELRVFLSACLSVYVSALSCIWVGGGRDTPSSVGGLPVLSNSLRSRAVLCCVCLISWHAFLLALSWSRT